MTIKKSFIEIIEIANPSIQENKKDLDFLCKHFSLDRNCVSKSRKEIEKFLKDKILNIISLPGTMHIKTVENLKDQFLFESLVFGNELQPYYRILGTITDFRHELKHPLPEVESNKQLWIEAVSYIKYLNLLFPFFANNEIENIKIMNQRIVAFSKRAKVLQNQNYDVQLENGQLVLPEEEQNCLFREIDSIVKSLGGFSIAKNIFKYIKCFYNEAQNRYHIARPSADFSGNADSALPFGYLLNLCAKNNNDPLKTDLFAKHKFEQLIDLSSSLLATYDLQFYNKFELIHSKFESIPDLLRKIVLFDETFTIPQYRPSDAIRVIEYLYNDYNNNELKSDLG